VCSFGEHAVTLKEIARCSLKVEPLAERMMDALTGNRKLSLLLKKDRKTAFLQGAKGSDAETRSAWYLLSHGFLSQPDRKDQLG
jgi:hypothetical protein